MAMGVVGVEDVVDTVETVEPETVTTASALIAKLSAIQQMQAESGNALWREETTIIAFVSSTGFQNMSNSIESPTNVTRCGGK